MWNNNNYNIVVQTILLLTMLIIIQYTIATCPDMCYCELEITDCKYKDLSTLPNNLDVNLTSLDLSHNNFENIPQTLKFYKNLRHLNFSHNKISTLSYSALEGLPKLEQLDFTYNTFFDSIDIKASAFYGTINLIYLDFSHNPIRKLPSFRLKSLETLKCNNCSLRNFNANVIYTLPSLKELRIANNPLTTIDSELQSDSLKFLDLSECNLKYINELSLYNLTALETLWLYNNKNLKGFNCASNSLLYIDLSNCNLEAIPRNYLGRVHEANFHGNHFRSIAKYSFHNFSSLKYIDLSYNAISVIEEDAFHGLKDLEIVDLSLNTLTGLDETIFNGNSHLRKLNLSHNYFNKVGKLTLESLELLDLSSCEIHAVDQNILIGLPNLKRLNLSKNIISVLPEYLDAINLMELDLSWCHIKTLNNRTFALMLSLRDLNLSGNRLTSASPDYFNQIINIDISDNPWRCDCITLKPMYLWLSKTGKRLDKLICQSPDKYEGQSWLTACRPDWYPETTRQDHIWWYSVGLIITMLTLLLIIIIMRRIVTIKEKRLQEVEDARRSEERETLRRMRRIQIETQDDETTARNAPDPREMETPPSYNEALLLPRLDASHPSLSGSLYSIASKHSGHGGSNPDVTRKQRVRRKRRRRKSDSSVVVADNNCRRVSRSGGGVDTDTSEQDVVAMEQTPPVRTTTLESDF